MPQFKKYKLGELIHVQNGYAFKSEDLKSHGIPIIKIKNIQPPNISFEEADYYPHELNGRLNQFVAKKKDILISMTGSHVSQIASAVGKVGRYGFDKPALINQRVGKLYSKDSSKLYNDYLYYFIAQPEIQFELATNAGGSANQANISPQDIKDLEIELPDIESQTRIASILSSLDDKIELNRRTTQTLEQIAQTLFKNYFVDDIDPENLPEGWRWGKLSEVFCKSKDSINPGKFSDKSFHHYSLPAYDETKRPTIETGSSILSNKFVVKSNSILFSKLNPRFPRIWPIGIIDESISICSTEFLVFIPNRPANYSFTYLQLMQEDLISDLVNKATGTSGSHQRIRPDEILELDGIIPNNDSLDEFERQIRPFLNKSIENIDENLTLTKIRDSLLPKLMSGEIEVNAEEKELVI